MKLSRILTQVKKLSTRIYSFTTERWIISMILYASLMTFILIQIHKNFPESAPSSPIFKITNTEPPPYQCCNQLNNSFNTDIFFIKTHKTGGSTVQSILLRFAMRNLLDLLYIDYRFYNYYFPFTDFSIHQDAVTKNNKYNIMAQHVRYHSSMKSYQYPNGKLITILRHPTTHFPSLYQYYKMNQSMGMTLERFLNTPNKPRLLISTTSFFEHQGYNQMSFDLGFDLGQDKNATAIDEFITKIDREFDFVLIMEHIEACLVLLANLMGWPLEELAHLKLNARPSDQHTLSLHDEITIMDLNHVDVLLYRHFLMKFKKCAKQYGLEKLNRQITELRILNEKLQQRCISEINVRDPSNGLYLNVVQYQVKNQSDLECVYTTLSGPPLERIAYDVIVKRRTK